MRATRSFVDIFFSFDDALVWATKKIMEEHDWLEEDVAVFEIKQMKSGGYRAGIIIENKQTDLFGATEDA